MISPRPTFPWRRSCNALPLVLACVAGSSLAALPSESGSVSGAVWYAIPAAFLLGVLAALAIYSRLQGQRRRPITEHAKPLASPENTMPANAAAGIFLVQQGGDGGRFEISHTPYRIGRASDRNEMMLRHPSISRRHAQITVRKDGVYEITDMDSLNGLFVNDRKVKASPLANGDIIDIGDLTFRFTTRPD